MSDFVIVNATRADGLIVPTPRCAVSVRLAVAGDVPFIDQLQKMHRHMVGWMPGAQLEGKIEAGQVLVAEGEQKNSLGYVIAQDQYMGRDDLGVVYQLNVQPLKQRNLIGATLIKSVFERAAYGCKLFCCWCAQDIQANWFWESVGFVPLAFRTGSRDKQRTHIFWQRRIREGDETTPYWFPSQTKSGALREDRLVLPIPLGTHWRDAKPIVLPEIIEQPKPELPKELPGGAAVRPRPEQPKLTVAQRAVINRAHSKHLKGVPLGKKAVITASGIKYVERTDYVPELDAPDELLAFEEATKKPKRDPKPRMKNDPKLITFTRELRDRYLEQVNTPGGAPELMLTGKYAVGKLLEAPTVSVSSTAVEKPALPPSLAA